MLTLLVGLACVVSLFLYAIRQNISIYVTPSEIADASQKDYKSIRLGGMVVKGTIKHFISDPLLIEFDLTDYKKDVTVHYRGVLPDLFRVGQGIVAQGYWSDDQVFVAREVLAKHNEMYRPPKINDPEMIAQQDMP